MILILSENADVSTDYTIEWFHYCNIPFIRLNQEDLRNTLTHIEFKGQQLQVAFRFKGQQITLNDILGVWFRRGFLEFTSDFFNVTDKDLHVKQQVAGLLERENQTLLSFLTDRLTTLRSLNSQLQYNANKLQTLLQAQQAGLNIPHTLIATDRQQVYTVLGNDDSCIITKPIQDTYDMDISSTKQHQYMAALRSYPPQADHFYYSLFQERLQKKYELRIFFIEDRFYTCAIFTKGSLGQETRVNNVPVRMVPFSLPDQMRVKLLRFVQLSGLNSGSIDMVVDNSNEYYFLEVNPVGQFGYISKPCNYCLYREIANFFKHE